MKRDLMTAAAVAATLVFGAATSQRRRSRGEATQATAAVRTPKGWSAFFLPPLNRPNPVFQRRGRDAVFG